MIEFLCSADMKYLLICLLFFFQFSYIFSQDELEILNSGVPPSTSACDTYLRHQDWLPDEFVNNAICACLKIPDEKGSNIIRQILIQRLDSVDMDLKEKSIKMKLLFAKKEISRRSYNKFIKREITPIIHRDHVIAYDLAGCDADPAPYFGWKQITTRKIKNCNLIWFSIRYFGGSCSGKWGRW